MLLSAYMSISSITPTASRYTFYHLSRVYIMFLCIFYKSVEFWTVQIKCRYYIPLLGLASIICSFICLEIGWIITTKPVSSSNEGFYSGSWHNSLAMFTDAPGLHAWLSCHLMIYRPVQSGPLIVCQLYIIFNNPPSHKLLY